jgi:hypothetical protein
MSLSDYEINDLINTVISYISTIYSNADITNFDQTNVFKEYEGPGLLEFKNTFNPKYSEKITPKIYMTIENDIIRALRKLAQTNFPTFEKFINKWQY